LALIYVYPCGQQKQKQKRNSILILFKKG